MTNAIHHAIYAFVITFLVAACALGNVGDLKTAAHVIAWGGIVLPFGGLCFAMWCATRPGVDMADFLRPIANEPEQPVIEVVKMLLLAGLLMGNGWLFATFAYLSLEISTLVLLCGIKRFVSHREAQQPTEGVATVRSIA